MAGALGPSFLRRDDAQSLLCMMLWEMSNKNWESKNIICLCGKGSVKTANPVPYDFPHDYSLHASKGQWCKHEGP